MKNKFVIIGCSAAGMAAAAAIRKQDSKSIIRMISEEPYPPYARIFLPKIISGEAALSDIVIRSKEQIRRLGIELIKGVSVKSINPAKKILLLDENSQIEFDRLLIAAGASPKIPDIDGITLRGVYGLRTVRDAEEIRRQAQHCKRAVIIGGGLVSLKAAEALAHFDLDINIIVRSSRLLSQTLDKESAELVFQTLRGRGITVHFGCDVVEIYGKNKTQGVILSNDKNIPCQMVIAGKGVEPNLSFLKSSGIKTDKGILVDNRQRTNLPDIYAAGDIAQTADFFEKGKTIKALWPNAVQQGKAAGLNMSGKQIENPEEINANIVNLFGIDLASCGQINVKNDSYYEMTYQDDGVYRRLIFKKDVLVGAVLAGNVNSIGVLRALILNKKKICDKKDVLMDKNFSFASILESVVL